MLLLLLLPRPPNAEDMAESQPVLCGPAQYHLRLNVGGSLLRVARLQHEQQGGAVVVEGTR